MNKERLGRPSSPENSTYEPDEVGFESHTVHMGEIFEVPPGDEVFMQGVAVCAAVIFYEPATKRALASHVPASDYPLSEFLKKAHGCFSDITQVQVFLAGASTEGDVADREFSGLESASKTFRENLFSDLATAGISPSQIVRTRFNDDPRASMDVVFDTRDGKMKVRRVKF